jgi:hypothetical protein
MSSEKDETKRVEGQNTRPWHKRMPCGPSSSAMADCCGSDASERAESCSCGAVLKEHRFAVFTVFTGIALTFLVGVTGSILGIIAFFRTI